MNSLLDDLQMGIFIYFVKKKTNTIPNGTKANAAGLSGLRAIVKVKKRLHKKAKTGEETW